MNYSVYDKLVEICVALGILLNITVHDTIINVFFVCFLGFFFARTHAACGILVPPPGTEPGPPEVRVQSPNHWTVREFPYYKCLDQFILAPQVIIHEIKTLCYETKTFCIYQNFLFSPEKLPRFKLSFTSSQFSVNAAQP